MKPKVALIIPPYWSILTPPLGIAMIAKALRLAGNQVHVEDFNLRVYRHMYDVHNRNLSDMHYNKDSIFLSEGLADMFLFPSLQKEMDALVDRIKDFSPNVVGFSVFYSGIVVARKIAIELKKQMPDVKIIIGGPFVTRDRLGATSEFGRGYLDAAVHGEGDVTAVELVDRLVKGKALVGCKGVIHTDPGSGKIVCEPPRASLDLSELPIPDFEDFLPLSNYARKMLPVSMARGCVLKCTFCEETRLWKKYRYKTGRQMFEEIQNLVSRYYVHDFYFCDSLLNGNFNELESFAKHIIDAGLEIRWEGYARLDKRMTKDFLHLLARAGCRRLAYGLETGSQKLNNLMKKGTSVSMSKEIVRHSHNVGIAPHLQVIVGFPGEEDGDFEQTYSFIKELSPYIHGVSISEMFIVPNTPVYDSPEVYGVDRASIERGFDWSTEDKRNTADVRKHRKKLLGELAVKAGLETFIR